MGKVYLAHQSSVDRPVALKILNPDMMDNPVVVKRFLLEAKATSRLTSPHTVTIYDFGETTDEDKLLFIAMEHLKGRTLRERLDAEGPVSLTEALRLMRGVAASIAEAHDAHIIHRDLKPENIFLAETAASKAFVKVLDFGVARAHSISGTKLTHEGAMAGTPCYMSPEAIAGEKIDARADIYAMGVVLYELLAGRPPYLAETAIGVMMRHLQDEPPPLSVVNPGLDVPGAVVEFLWRSLAKSKERRPRDARAFIREFEEAIAGPAGAGSPISTGTGFRFEVGATPGLFAETMHPEASAPPLPVDTAQVYTTDSSPPSVPHSRPWLVPSLVGAIAGLIVLLVVLVGNEEPTPEAPPEEVAAKTAPPAEREAPQPAEPEAPQPAAQPEPEPEPEGGQPAPAPSEVEVAPELVSVHFASEPFGAQVFVAEESICETPCSHRFAKGETVLPVRFALEGFEPWTSEVVPDGDKDVATRLTKAPAPKAEEVARKVTRKKPKPRPKPKPDKQPTGAKEPVAKDKPAAPEPEPKPAEGDKDKPLPVDDKQNLLLD